MAARIRVLIVAASLLRLTEVSSQLPKPDNVTVVSFNMGAVLTWDIPEYSPSNLTYTAQMRGLDEFQTVCNHTGDRHCDMGPVPSCLGVFVLRVRAEAGTAKSCWVKVLHKPSEDTVIGAPTLQVEFKAEEVEVVMADPVLRVLRPLTDCYSKVSYVLQYWRKDRPDHVLEKKGVADKRVRLRLNDPGNSYCIQARVDPYGREGLFSEPVCDQSGDNKLPGRLVVGLALASLALPLSLLVGWLTYKANRFLNPKTALPSLLQKHLSQANATTIDSTNQRAPALTQEQSEKISLFYEEHSICEVVLKQDHGCDDNGNNGEGEGLKSYCNFLQLNHWSYRNL
ncbi:interleukin-10 receptor subunit beta-like isoform X2 [Gadus macrocephalus]|uniref:interleukin-10 receptor subunit beta-like isoform X2 n=1 Tax=Gadus macrocephalus TaxID=80720 RepID=UPI0028CB87FC|nr:interleukin-10 receptor subunit beta-like isoform X2 [Gadus macrocephalus]